MCLGTLVSISHLFASRLGELIDVRYDFSPLEPGHVPTIMIRFSGSPPPHTRGELHILLDRSDETNRTLMLLEQACRCRTLTWDFNQASRSMPQPSRVLQGKSALRGEEGDDEQGVLAEEPRTQPH